MLVGPATCMISQVEFRSEKDRNIHVVIGMTKERDSGRMDGSCGSESTDSEESLTVNVRPIITSYTPKFRSSG